MNLAQYVRKRQRTDGDWWAMRRKHGALRVECTVCPSSVECLRLEVDGTTGDRFRGVCHKCHSTIEVMVHPPPRDG